MKATQILMEEHRVIERVLDALSTAADLIDQGVAVDPEFFLDATDFVRGFADGCHHKKEEDVLFKTMASYGVQVENGPIGVMLADHEEGRRFTRQIRAAAERLQAGDQAARSELLNGVKGYVALLRAHIFKEDKILFPMADQVIPTDVYAKVDEGFEHVEHEETGEGVHEKFLALAEKLEAGVKVLAG